MTAPDRVSVVTTCWNEARYLPDAVHSVASQIAPVREHVIVDDGSTDESLSIARQLEQDYDHVRVISITNRTMPNARNAGLLALRPCDYVVFCDADDWLAPTFVVETLACALEEDADCVVPALRRHDRRGIHEPVLPTIMHPTLTQLWQACSAWSCGLFRREMLSEIGGFHGLMSGDCDWDFWVDVTSRGYRIAYCDATHVNYRVHAESYTRRLAASERDRNKIEMARHFRGRLPLAVA